MIVRPIRLRLLALIAIAAVTECGIGTRADASNAGAPLPEPLASSIRSYADDPAIGPEIRSLAAEAVHLGTNAELLAALLERAHDAALPSEQAVAILRRVVRIAEAKLPAEPVADKMLQGLTKGVSFDRIVAVVETVEARLVQAALEVDAAFPSARLGDAQVLEARRAAIDHGAFALSAGVSSPALAQSLALVAPEANGLTEADSPLLALGCLAAGGLAVDRSLEVVELAWAQGYHGHDLERLGWNLGGLTRDGEPPSEESLDRVIAWLRAGTSPDVLFHDLDAMHRALGHEPPGMAPGSDPTHMHGPGGPPHDPGHMGPGGHHREHPRAPRGAN